MRVWDDKQPSSAAMHPKPAGQQQQQQQPKKMDYSSCPLKKRPVNYSAVDRDLHVSKRANMMNFVGADAEPENLSTKPQDLSLKGKPAAAMQTAPLKRELTSSPDEPPSYQLHHNIATPPPSPAYQPPVPMQLQQDLRQNSPPPPPRRANHHPYQPLAVKPGPLEPLCLNIAAGDYAAQQQHHHHIQLQQQQHHVQSYHGHHLQQPAGQQHHIPPQHGYSNGPLVPVPVQYPAGAGYAYQQAQLQRYPSAVGTVLVHHQPSLQASPRSPPGAAGSAFRPLQQRTSPPQTQQLQQYCSPPLPPPPPAQPLYSPPQPLHQRHMQLNGVEYTWYERPWSAPVDPLHHQLSPPHTLSLSSPSPSASSAVSPPYGLQQQQQQQTPPQPPVYLHQVPAQIHVQHQPAAEDRNNNNNNGPAIAESAVQLRFACGRCSKTYASGSGLTKHQQKHCVASRAVAVAPPSAQQQQQQQQQQMQPEAPAQQQQQDNARFRCKFCDKAYNTLGALKMHIRTHTLPCICTLCGKAFSRPWLLQGHIRTHTGEKPFSCPFCNRAFADRSNLRAHLQTHSDVKKYSCPSCSKTFSRMSLLTKHCDTGCPRLHASSASGADGSGPSTSAADQHQ